MNKSVKELNRLVDLDHLLATLVIMAKQQLNDFPDQKEEQKLNSQLLEIKRKQAIISKEILAAIQKRNGIKAPGDETYQKITKLLSEVNEYKKRAVKTTNLLKFTTKALGLVEEFYP